jgi:hypothetical protein
MLRRPEGATVAEVASATGWQRHAGAASSREPSKKLRAHHRLGQEERGRVYRIAELARA